MPTTPAQPLKHIIQQQQQNKKPTTTPTPTNTNTKTNTNTNTGGADDMLKGQWPPKLKAFVERTFETCADETERQAIEAELKSIITKSIQEGTLWNIDWDREVLSSYVHFYILLLRKTRLMF